jgi:hypothetical protein
VELHLHSTNTPSWHDAYLKDAKGQLYLLLLYKYQYKTVDLDDDDDDNTAMRFMASTVQISRVQTPFVTASIREGKGKSR